MGIVVVDADVVATEVDTEEVVEVDEVVEMLELEDTDVDKDVEAVVDAVALVGCIDVVWTDVVRAVVDDTDVVRAVEMVLPAVEEEADEVAAMDVDEDDLSTSIVPSTASTTKSSTAMIGRTLDLFALFGLNVFGPDLFDSDLLNLDFSMLFD